MKQTVDTESVSAQLASRDASKDRVLLVEDNESLRNTLVKILDWGGYEVAAVCNGEQACEMFAKESFDVLITDILLSCQDGLEVLQEFRRRCPGQRVIAMSGGGNHFDSSLCLELAKRLGADVILRKPFAFAELMDALREPNQCQSFTD